MADWGLQTWNNAGQETMGPNTRNGIFKGQFSMLGGTSTSSHTDPTIAGKTVFWIPQFGSLPEWSYDVPTINFNAATGTWSWSTPLITGFTISYGAR